MMQLVVTCYTDVPAAVGIGDCLCLCHKQDYE